jgi:hypothetical protein
MRKRATLILTAVLASSSLIIVNSAFAQSMFKPSVPEFTLEYIDNSYDVPPQPTSSTDPYTNKTTTTTIPGYHVKNQTIELTIKNQPYPTNIDGNKTSLTYLIQIKPHFSEDWETETRTSQAPADGEGFTVNSFQTYYRVGDQVDFRVQAILEYEHTIYTWTRLPIFGSSFGSVPENVTDVYDTSEWSPTQTLIVPSPSPSSSPLTTEQVNTIVVIAIIAVVLGATFGLLVYVRKRKREAKQT